MCFGMTSTLVSLEATDAANQQPEYVLWQDSKKTMPLIFVL